MTMTIDDKIAGVPGVPQDSAGISRIPGPSQALPEVRGADFSRILEELMQAAGKLDAKAENAPAQNPQELREAVEEARQSLDTAMSLSETLLEAYRRTLVPGPGGAPGGKTPA